MASHKNLSNLERLSRFIEEVLFVSFPQPQKIYIFLDEIDVLVKCRFKHEFLAFIRYCYNRLAEDEKSDYQRLVFCLFGVLTSGDLITNVKYTPFNIGYPIQLTELTFAAAREVLNRGLIGVV